MSRKAVAEAFVGEAEARFGFLSSEGFLGPECAADSLTYHSPTLSVEIALDERAREVVTIVRATGEHELIAEFSRLYVEAGLGPAQHVPRKATSLHSLETVLKSQSTALAALLPTVSQNPTGRDVIERCHRR